MSSSFGFLMMSAQAMDGAQRSWARRWMGPLLLGVWLSVTALWPIGLVPIGKTQLMWQPLLLVTLAFLVLRRGPWDGWGLWVGRALWIAALVNVAGWLPSVHNIPTDLPPAPKIYNAYLAMYEVGLAALVGWQAALSMGSRVPSWWTLDNWSRPLVVAPVLLVLRSVQAGGWVVPVVGIGLGASLGAWQGRRGWMPQFSPRVWKLVPVVLFLAAASLVYVSSFRIYSLTGAEYPNASDDGLAYYFQAVDFSKNPRLFFTSELHDQIFFSGYYVLMGLWFRLVGGAHIPSWLLWHGVAGGLLAVTVYWIGRRLTGRAVLGVVAGVLAVGDHVMLHLLSTMNQETFYFACVYGALLLWALAILHSSPETRARASLLAGLVLGVSAVFRTTSILLPILWYLLLLVERPKPSVSLARRQTGWFLLGVLIPVGLMVIRHRIAWGYWTLTGTHAEYKIIGWNYALQLHNVHLMQIGLVGWLRMLAAEPQLLWQHVIPSWWEQGVELWTHRGFGQMDLVQGWNYPGSYQAALTSVLSASALVGFLVAIRRRTRLDLALLSVPLLHTSLVLLFYVLNSRYRAPFIPVLYLLSCLGLSLAWTTVRSRAPAMVARAPDPQVPGRELLGTTGGGGQA